MQQQCLVFLDSPVVAQDLALTMRDILGCGPIIASSLDEAESHLETLSHEAPLPFAFVHLSPSAYRISRLNAQLSARGTKVVLIGHAAEMEADHGEWPVLMQPFSSAQVAEMITRLVV